MVFFFFETGSHYEAQQASFIPLLQPPEITGIRHSVWLECGFSYVDLFEGKLFRTLLRGREQATRRKWYHHRAKRREKLKKLVHREAVNQCPGRRVYEARQTIPHSREW